MRHSQNDFLDALIGGFLDGEFQQRNQALGPFQGKALRAQKFFTNKLFEALGVDQPAENAHLVGAIEF